MIDMQRNPVIDDAPETGSGSDLRQSSGVQVLNGNI